MAEEEKVPERDYTYTWGSNEKVKQEYADKAKEEKKETSKKEEKKSAEDKKAEDKKAEEKK